MLILGEVHTGLLRNSTAVSPAVSARMLAFVAGEQVIQTQRPLPSAVSPTQLTGVDCDLVGRSGAATRAVGTVESRAVLTGGRILQGSAWLRVERAVHGRRLPWAHYLARPGCVETMSRHTTTDLGDGFLRGRTTSALDLAAICRRGMEKAQEAKHLDSTAPFRVPQTRVRWFATTQDDDKPATVAFGVEDETVRTVRLRLHPEALVDGVDLCESLALHDWLLSAQQHLIERGAAGGPAAGGPVTQLWSAVELLHLWMPAARMRPSWSKLWEALDREAGLTLQWTTSTHRIRDALNLALLERPPGAVGVSRPAGSR
jgi:hypothetical protein